MPQPQFDAGGAVDLDQVKAAKAAEEAARKLAEEKRAEEKREALERYAQAWDNAMNRAFKGIVSRPARHRMMLQRGKVAE